MTSLYIFNVVYPVVAAVDTITFSLQVYDPKVTSLDTVAVPEQVKLLKVLAITVFPRKMQKP